jgi:hypothetical protein
MKHRTRTIAIIEDIKAHPGLPLAEIGRRHGVSRQYVHQIRCQVDIENLLKGLDKQKSRVHNQSMLQRLREWFK